MKTLLLIDAIEALLSLAVNAGINIQKLNAMREANGGEPLSAEQRQELADDAQDAIDRL